MSDGYPNLFTITGPQSPSVLSNMPVSIEQHVEFIGRIIGDMRERGAVHDRADQAGRGRLGRAHDQELAAGHAVPDGGHLVHGRQHPGQAAGVPAHLDFVGPYRQKCDEIAAHGYEGFFDLAAPRRSSSS